MAMKKMKSHSGTKKRFRRSGTGKIMRRKAGARHILTSKRRDRKRRLKGLVEVSSTQTVAIARLIPYNS